MNIMDEAYNFVILDLESSNAVAFPRPSEAQDTFLSMIRADESRAESLSLVGLDKRGFTVSSYSAADFGFAIPEEA
jgi:hypothetical protein